MTLSEVKSEEVIEALVKSISISVPLLLENAFKRPVIDRHTPMVILAELILITLRTDKAAILREEAGLSSKVDN